MIAPRVLPGGRLRFGVAAMLVVLAVWCGALMTSGGGAEASAQPNFLLPWQDGQSWLTGSAGFHATNDAIDFFPPDTPLGGGVKCEGDPNWVYQESSYYVLSSAAGEVVVAGNAMVLIDHGAGWQSRHYHMTGFVVEVGDYVQAGQRLARPSTLGACSSGPHNHFWVSGPNGETTADVTLSGMPTTQIGANQWISQTGNFEGVTPTPEPTPTPTTEPPPAPTETPVPEPTDSPTPTPKPLLRGDANCDDAVSALDAITIVRALGDEVPVVCDSRTADADCDGALSPGDALVVLRHVSEVAEMPLVTCFAAASAP